MRNRSYRLSDDVSLVDLTQLINNYYAYLGNFTYVSFWGMLTKFIAQHFARLQALSACSEAENQAGRKALKCQIDSSLDLIDLLITLQNTLSINLSDELPNSADDKICYRDSMHLVLEEMVAAINHQLPTNAEMKVLKGIAATMIDLYKDPANLEKYNAFDNAVKKVPANPMWKNIVIAIASVTLASVLIGFSVLPPVLLLTFVLPTAVLLHAAAWGIARALKNPETRPEGKYFHKGYTFDEYRYDYTLSGRLNECRSNCLSLLRKHSLIQPKRAPTDAELAEIDAQYAMAYSHPPMG
jgi:hypothetical protein